MVVNSAVPGDYLSVDALGLAAGLKLPPVTANLIVLGFAAGAGPPLLPGSISWRRLSGKSPPPGSGGATSRHFGAGRQAAAQENRGLGSPCLNPLAQRLPAFILRHRTGLAVTGLALVLLALPLRFSNPYILSIFIQIGLLVIVVLGLNLFTGYAGQISLGPRRFFRAGGLRLRHPHRHLCPVRPWPAMLHRRRRRWP